MDRRMRVYLALIFILMLQREISTLTSGIEGPVSKQAALEDGSVVLKCDISSNMEGDELMLLVWYKNETPIYSYDARTSSEWSSDTFNTSHRLHSHLQAVPSELLIQKLTVDDEAIYHCRVDFLVAPTRNTGINLTVIVLPSQPFFLDELGNKVEDKIGPYQEGDTLVISCLVIGGRPAPRISWYSGDYLIDVSYGASDIPGVNENILYLLLTREHTAPLSCQASNSALTPPIISRLQIEIYLPAENVSISWMRGAVNNTLRAGQVAVAKCSAPGSYPQPDIIWSLNQKHLVPRSRQEWINENSTAESIVEFTPSVGDDGATLSCIATNMAMPHDKGSRSDVIKINVTYSPIIEVIKVGDEKIRDIVELDALHLECEVKANPPVHQIVWYFNDVKILAQGMWRNINMTSNWLYLSEATRDVSGQYSCSATNTVGETRAQHIAITILYPPACTQSGITLNQETVMCHVNSLPSPDTYFWQVQPSDSDVQQLTTGSPLLPLSQLLGSLSGILHVKCEASNGIASQEKSCEKILNLAHLRPPQPKQCDLVYENKLFKVRCISVENATHYEVSVWKMSASNSSLTLARRSEAGAFMEGPAAAWRVAMDAEVGMLCVGDEAGVAACNRYGCSRAMLLRPTESPAPAWYHVFLDKDVGIALGAVVLITAFILSTLLLRRLLRRGRRAKPPVIQVLQLDDVAREYLDSMEQKHHASCSVRSCSARSCSSGYSGGSMDFEAPAVDRQRKPPNYFWDPGPPPDVTLTLSRESAV